jgi:hypothetical protein
MGIAYASLGTPKESHHMNRNVRCAIPLLFTVLAVSLGLASSARADRADRLDTPGRLRLLGGAHFGIGGTLEGDRSPFNGEYDLATTYGGHLGVDAVVFRFFAIGGEVRASAINTEEAEARNIDRSVLIDLDVKPRLRIPFVRERFELYFSTPVGLTIPVLSDDIALDGRVDGQVGWNLGIGGGMTFFITRHFGLNLEPMYVMRWFGVEGPGGTEVDLKMRQFTLFTNAVFAF